MREQNFLFREGELSDTLACQGSKIEGIVDSIPKDQLLCTPIDDLVDNIVSQLYIDPLTIYEDRMVRDEQEIKMDVSGLPGRFSFGDGPLIVPGIQVVVSLPFTGESNLWQLGTNVFGPIPPYGIIRGSNLEMVFKCPKDRPLEGIKRDLDENLGRIKENILRQNTSIAEFNKSLSGRIRTTIEDRKQRLAKYDKLTDILNIPLKHSPNAPKIQPIPIQRRIIKPLPAPPTGGYKPEPGIPEQEYENILTIIRHVGRTFEATRKTYASLHQ